MHAQPFPKSVRLRHKLEFRRTLDQGRKTVCPKMVLIGRERPASEPGAGVRLGLIVSRKVGNSVVRNRVKRHLRESFRHMHAELEQGGVAPPLDLVVIARADAARAEGLELQEALRACFGRFNRPRKP